MDDEYTPAQKSDIRQGFLMFFLLGIALTGFVSSVHNSLIEKPRHQAAIQEALDTCPETMYCYEPYGAPVVAQYILNGTFVLIRWLPEDQMPPDTEAYAQWEVDFESNYSVCVITATPPQQVLGDPRMDALGHELLHCLVGSFHP